VPVRDVDDTSQIGAANPPVSVGQYPVDVDDRGQIGAANPDISQPVLDPATYLDATTYARWVAMAVESTRPRPRYLPTPRLRRYGPNTRRASRGRRVRTASRERSPGRCTEGADDSHQPRHLSDGWARSAHTLFTARSGGRFGVVRKASA